MIQIDNISMNYGSVKAVDSISFNVKEGEILGLLGPNGAGKSTTLKILTTYIVPTSGQITVDGLDTQKNPLEVRRRIGYLPEATPLWLDMSVNKYLSFVASARGIASNKIKERVNWVVEACALHPVYKKTIIELSHGYRQRVGIAQALIHDPKIVILDEPTSGLDPLQIIGIRELIKNLSKEKTIIFSTHILQEVTALSDRVVIINEGKIIANDRIKELEKNAMKYNRSELTVEAEKEEVEKGLNSISNVNSCKFIDAADGLSRFEIYNNFNQPIWRDIDKLVKDNSWNLRSYKEKPITFEETFIELTQRAIQGNRVEGRAAA